MDATTRLLLSIKRVTYPTSSTFTVSTSTLIDKYDNNDTRFISDNYEYQWLMILLCFFVSLLILATIIGNAMVCLAILLVRKLKQQPANLLLISLAMADFSVGLIVMPMALIYFLEDRWILGNLNFLFMISCLKIINY